MIRSLIAMWGHIPSPVQKWIKGAEVAVVSAVVGGFVLLPVSDLTTKTGVFKFVGGIVSLAYGGLRLYITQSPVQNVIKEVVTEQTAKVGDVELTSSSSETTTK